MRIDSSGRVGIGRDGNINTGCRLHVASGSGGGSISIVYIEHGDYVFNNSFSLNSVLSGAPEKAELGYVEPQYVKSYDLGYRINGKKTALDINAYYTEWDNFIASKTVITPAYTLLGGLAALSVQDWKVFNVDSNTDEEVSTYGASVGLETALLKVFDLNVTASYNKMLFERALDPDF